MRATLWQRSGEEGELVREILRGLFKLAGIDFTTVETCEALLAATDQSRRASDTHILVFDCYTGEPTDVERCAAVLNLTIDTMPPIIVIHPDEQVVRDLEGIAAPARVVAVRLHRCRAIAQAACAAGNASGHGHGNTAGTHTARTGGCGVDRRRVGQWRDRSGAVYNQEYAQNACAHAMAQVRGRVAGRVHREVSRRGKEGLTRRNPWAEK